MKVDTTLLVYFFGRRGNDQLRFEDFQPFVENLQTEVLQMEYHEFSKGADTITELDFARILLRYVSTGILSEIRTKLRDWAN